MNQQQISSFGWRFGLRFGLVLLLFLALCGSNCGCNGCGTTTTNTVPAAADNIAALTTAIPAGNEARYPSLLTAATLVTGTVAKGAINGATLRFYQLASDGYSAGGAVAGGAVLSDQYGHWSVILPAGVRTPLLVQASGGSFVDEYSGQTLIAGLTMRSLLIPATTSHVVISPLTEAMVRSATTIVQNSASNGTTGSMRNAMLAVAYEYQNQFGFNPLTTSPQFDSYASGGGNLYAALLGGFSLLVSRVATQSGAGIAASYDAVMRALATNLAANGDYSGSVVLPGSAPVTVPAAGATVGDLANSFLAGNSAAALKLKTANPALFNTIPRAKLATLATVAGYTSMADGLSWTQQAGSPNGFVTFSGTGATRVVTGTTFAPALGVRGTTTIVWTLKADNGTPGKANPLDLTQLVVDPYANRLTLLSQSTWPTLVANDYTTTAVTLNAIAGVNLDTATNSLTLTNVTLTSGDPYSAPTTLLVNGKLNYLP